jgi:hypothetical protein
MSASLPVVPAVARWRPIDGFAALRHYHWREYNALRHVCQGFFAALRHFIY